MNIILSKGSENAIVKKYTLNSDNTITLEIFRPSGELIMIGKYHSKYKKFTPDQLTAKNVSLFSPDHTVGNKIRENSSVLLSERFSSLKVNTLMTFKGAISGTGGTEGTDDPEDECPPGVICLDDVIITAPEPEPNEPDVPGIDLPNLPPVDPIDYFPTDPTMPVGNDNGGGSNSAINKDIIDSLQGYPCAQVLIKEMKTNICTDIATLIKNTFAKNDLVNITFKADNSLVGTATDGQEAEGNSSVYTAEFTVGLNPDVLNKSSQEYIIVTMYHEALHAFFDRKFKLLGEAEFKRQYEGVQVNGGRLLGVFDDDHTPMAYQKYVDGLKDVIMKFNTSFSEDRARILAKGGIIQFLSGEKTINDQERDTTKPGFTGTKCL